MRVVRLPVFRPGAGQFLHEVALWEEVEEGLQIRADRQALGPRKQAGKLRGSLTYFYSQKKNLNRPTRSD